MSTSLKRVYDKADPDDCYRALVDRLWPRGVSKETVKIDQWIKEAAPSDKLRKDSHNGDLSWDEFRKAYLSELKDHRKELRELSGRARNQQVTLLFSSHDEKRNNAVVLKQYLKMPGNK